MANSSVTATGIVKGAADIYNSPSGAEIVMNFNGRGDQLVALGLPQRTELARIGAS